MAQESVPPHIRKFLPPFRCSDWNMSNQNLTLFPTKILHRWRRPWSDGWFKHQESLYASWTPSINVDLAMAWECTRSPIKGFANKAQGQITCARQASILHSWWSLKSISLWKTIGKHWDKKDSFQLYLASTSSSPNGTRDVPIIWSVALGMIKVSWFTDGGEKHANLFHMTSLAGGQS